jgi:uncharacterized protein GlcG (DUF336 family)/NAD-dependent dihydropyrimidine dehydrogenase PreA subunit
VPYVITDACTKDGACVEVCPVACIHTRTDAGQFYVDPDICIECDQCRIVCPVDAIFADGNLPERSRGAIEVNAAFFRLNKPEVAPIALEAARAMIRAAEAYARRMGHSIAVAVVDGSSAVVAASQMSGADARSAELALHRASTAAIRQVPTDRLTDAYRAMDGSVTKSGALAAPAAGGVPIIDGLTTIGAIGVAGAATAGDDVLCCRAAFAALERGTLEHS